MADVLNFNVNRVWDINGDPVPFAQARFYNAGTSSVRQVYADQDGSVPHPSPLVADSEGVFPPVYTTGGEGVSVEITDEDGVMLDGYPVALAIRVPGDGFSASSIGFSPTGDIAATNVQAAIEQVQENLVAPLADYGLGVTGNGPLIANIDASDIPSGIYRYETTSTGTFPPGINAADGGTFTVWRRNNSSANMVVYPSSGASSFHRALVNGTWSAYTPVGRPTATAAQALAGTDDIAVVTPAKMKDAVRGALGATGTQQVFGVKAWAVFNVVSDDLVASGGFASGKNDSNDSTEFKFSVPMPNFNYSVVVSQQSSANPSGEYTANLLVFSKTTTGFKVKTNTRGGNMGVINVQVVA